jgi:hypothetical protein
MNPDEPSVQWLFARGLPRTLADTCIDINNPETFCQWASATQKHHHNWLHKRAIHGKYGQTQSHTNPTTGNQVPRYHSLPRNTPHPWLPPSDPDAMDTSAAVQRAKTLTQVTAVETQESEAVTPYRIAKILQAYNDDERNSFTKVMQEEDDEMGFSSCLSTMALT